MARDRRQPRWPAGTPVAPGGKGPGGGRFRDGGGPSGGTGVGGWLGKISDAIARRRGGGGSGDGPDAGDPPGHQRFPWETSDEDMQRQRAIRRRHGLPIDADPHETGEAIRYSATGGRVGSPGRSTTLGPQSGRPQIDRTMRVGPGPYDPATPLGRQSSQQPPTPPRPPARPTPNDGPDPGDPPGHWAQRIDDRISHGRFPSDYDLRESGLGEFEPEDGIIRTPDEIEDMGMSSEAWGGRVEELLHDEGLTAEIDPNDQRDWPSPDAYVQHLIDSGATEDSGDFNERMFGIGGDDDEDPNDSYDPRAIRERMDADMAARRGPQRQREILELLRSGRLAGGRWSDDEIDEGLFELDVPDDASAWDVARYIAYRRFNTPSRTQPISFQEWMRQQPGDRPRE